VVHRLGQWGAGFSAMIVSGLFSLVILCACVKVILDGFSEAWLLVPLLVAAMAASGWHVVATIVALMRPQLPAPMQVALTQPSWPRGTRCAMAVWWLIHLSAAAFMAIGVVIARPHDWLAVLLLSLLSTGFTYAACGYLLLAVTCFTRHVDWILFAWKGRHVCSVGHGLVVLGTGLLA
jgi:hypothetical protein